MRFTKNGGESVRGPADWFTGTVFIDGIRNPRQDSGWTSRRSWSSSTEER